MPTYHLQGSAIADGRVTITGPTAHHLLRVLRVKSGEPLRCTDGAGTVWQGVVRQIARDALVVELGPVERIAPPRPHITLAAALLPQDRWRYLVEKSVELGALIIQPLCTARTVVKERSDRHRREKWQAIANAAAEQCDSAWAPSVQAPRSLDAWMTQAQSFDRWYICHPDADARSTPAPVGQRIAILIGPEGGWTDTELAHAAASGAHPLSLGSLTLRAETAAVVALAGCGRALTRPEKKHYDCSHKARAAQRQRSRGPR